MKAVQERESGVRKRIIFYGRVQGVGFRYRAKYNALELGLTGWVENGWDGSVTMEVQGSEECIDRLIMHMCRERFIEVDRYEVTAAALQKEQGFHIR